VTAKSLAMGYNGRVSEAFALSRRSTATTSGSRPGSTAFAGRTAHAQAQLLRLTASGGAVQGGRKTRTLRRVMARKAAYSYVTRTEPPALLQPSAAHWRSGKGNKGPRPLKLPSSKPQKKSSERTVSVGPCSSLKQSKRIRCAYTPLRQVWKRALSQFLLQFCSNWLALICANLHEPGSISVKKGGKLTKWGLKTP